MIEDFTEDGLLPPHIHQATFEELVERLGFSRKRKEMLEDLKRALKVMRQHEIERVYIDGSFVTDKPRPSDIDVCYDAPEGADLSGMFPIYPPKGWVRDLSIEEYSAEFLPSDMIELKSGKPFLEFFQTDKENRPRGVVLIELAGEV